MTSALYTGWVRHRRFTPRGHEFKYRVFMPYLRLDELPDRRLTEIIGRFTGESP